MSTRKLVIISILVSCYFFPVQAAIRLLLSAALTANHFEFRKAQYIKSVALCGDFGYPNPYIVEALAKQGPTFLDDISSNVFYSQANNPSFKNNGINEALTVLDATRYFGFDSEDMVVKMTGRYYLLADNFIKVVEANPNADAVVLVDQWGNVFTLAFAMRCKYMQEMYANMDYLRMERYWINVEHEVGNYIKRKKSSGNFNVIYVSRLGVEAHLYGSSTAPNRPDETLIF